MYNKTLWPRSTRTITQSAEQGTGTRLVHAGQRGEPIPSHPITDNHGIAQIEWQTEKQVQTPIEKEQETLVDDQWGRGSDTRWQGGTAPANTSRTAELTAGYNQYG